MRTALAACLSLLLLGAAPDGAGSGVDPCDWPKYGRELSLSFAQDDGCSAIEPGNVSTLVPRWFLHTPDSISASPSVVDGVVYVGSWDGTFYALPAETDSPVPEPLWTFQVDDGNDAGFGRITSSAAVADVGGQRVVVFGGNSTLYVLDAATGTELTSACVDPRTEPPPPAEPIRCRGSDADIEILSSPAVFDLGGETRVVVGMDVHNRAGVGRTGLLSFRLVPPRSDQQGWRLEPLWKADPEAGLTYTTRRPNGQDRDAFVVTDDPLTHGGGSGSGCAGVWSSPAVDLDARLVFFGTSNCTRGETFADRFGGEGIWAADLDTGELLWQFRPRGVNDLDDDFGASPNLLPVTDADGHELVGIGGKDGVYYAFPRAPLAERGADGAPPTQQPTWTSHAGQAGHLNDGFAFGGMIGSAAVGVIGDDPTVFATTAISTPIEGTLEDEQPSLDASLADDPERMLSLHAIDAASGQIRWRAPLARASYGAPTYADGVVFVPSTFDFSIKAFDAATGNLLWTIPLDGPPSSAPAVVGDAVFIGVGTRTTDAEYKAMGGEPIEPVVGPHPLSLLSGIYAFELPS